mgnify:CR=1 FL=1
MLFTPDSDGDSVGGWLPSRGCSLANRKGERANGVERDDGGLKRRRDAKLSRVENRLLGIQPPHPFNLFSLSSSLLASLPLLSLLAREKPRRIESTNQQVVPLIRLTRFFLVRGRPHPPSNRHLSGSFSPDNGTFCAFTCRAFIEPHLLNVIFMHIVPKAPLVH